MTFFRGFRAALIAALLAMSSGALADPGELQLNLQYDDTALPIFARLAKAGDAAARTLVVEELLANPNYDVLIRNELPADVLTDLFAAAFGDKEDQYGAVGAAYSRHIGEAAGDFDILQAFAEDMIAVSSVYGEEIAEILLAVTPEDAFGTYDVPVGLLVFGYDARSYDRILLDILFAYKNIEALSWVLAHEVHHDIRYRHVEYDLDACSDARLREVLWTADQIQSEGIADLIDKDKMFELTVNAELRDKYNGLLKHAPEMISGLNTHVAQANFGALRNALPMAGHVVGRHVTETLKADFGQNPALVLQPSALLNAYNKLSPPESRFSADYISLVEKAEKECR